VQTPEGGNVVLGYLIFLAANGEGLRFFSGGGYCSQRELPLASVRGFGRGEAAFGCGVSALLPEVVESLATETASVVSVEEIASVVSFERPLRWCLFPA
jgi:hypothetical protein